MFSIATTIISLQTLFFFFSSEVQDTWVLLSNKETDSKFDLATICS